MNAWDGAISLFVNSFARQSGTFDGLIVLVSVNQLLKSAPLFIIYWFAWFRTDRDTGKRRESILLSFVACLVALAIARFFAIVLPPRLRPIDDPELHFIRPFGMEAMDLKAWSSFPSDHAVFYVALAVGVFAISRRLAWLALAYVIVLVLAPRLYLGLHFMTDLVAGGLLGAAIMWMAQRTYGSRSASRPLLARGVHWSEQHPAAFHVIAFLVTWQMAVLFDDLRNLASFSFQVVDQLALSMF